MFSTKESVYEIRLSVTVNGEEKELEFPVPFDYDGQAIVRIIEGDLEPGEDGAMADPESWVVDDGTVEITGAMGMEEFREWSGRADNLSEIDSSAFELDDLGLLAGLEPGPFDLRTVEPSAQMLDETIEHDLRNVNITSNVSKGAFRSMREACGASQAALAEALDVSPRTVKRWETPGQPEPPYEARHMVESWHADAMSGARWHVRRAEEMRDDCHEAYTLVVYRNQEEFDRALSPLLANAPSYRWQDAFAEAREADLAAGGDGSCLEMDHPYTNFPGTRSYWRANAAARMAALLMEEKGLPYGFAYPEEQEFSFNWEGVWVPRADVQRIESGDKTIIVCGMR